MKPPHACWYLHNKAYFFPPRVPTPGEEPHEPEAVTTPWWCLRTQDSIGPDGGMIGDDCCGTDRACYKPEVQL